MIPVSLWGLLVRTNMVLAEIEKQTVGVYTHQLVPRDTGELIEAILSHWGRQREEATRNAWMTLEANLSELRRRAPEDQGVEEVLMFSAPVISAITLRDLAGGMVREAQKGLREEFEKRKLQRRLLLSRERVEDRRPGTPAFEVFLDAHLPRIRALRRRLVTSSGHDLIEVSDTGSNGESLLWRVSLLLSAAAQGTYDVLRLNKKEISSDALRGLIVLQDLAAKLLDEVETLATLAKSGQGDYLSKLVPIASKAVALPDLLLGKAEESTVQTTASDRRPRWNPLWERYGDLWLSNADIPRPFSQYP